MENERVLLSITTMEEGVRTEADLRSTVDMVSVALSLCSLMRKNLSFATVVMRVLEKGLEDDTLDENTIEMPDFNKILKQNE